MSKKKRARRGSCGPTSSTGPKVSGRIVSIQEFEEKKEKSPRKPAKKK